MFLIYFLIQFIEQKKYYSEKLLTLSQSKIDSLKPENYTQIKAQNEFEVKEHNSILEEKIKSLNDRIGDLYLSFTIIIALLLTIVAGVYFKTSSEVAKHMNRNYGKYKKEIETINAESQVLLSEIKTRADLSEQILQRHKVSQNQSEPQQPEVA